MEEKERREILDLLGKLSKQIEELGKRLGDVEERQTRIVARQADGKRAAAVQSSDIREFVDYWNRRKDESKALIPAITTMYRSRVGKVRKLLAEFGIEEVKRGIDLAMVNKFMNGKNNYGWVMTVDYFLNKNKFISIVDGVFGFDSERVKQLWAGIGEVEEAEGMRLAGEAIDRAAAAYRAERDTEGDGYDPKLGF